MTAEQKAKALCQKMTLREKIGQITQTAAGYRCYLKHGHEITFDDTLKRVVSEYGGIGAISGLLRADPWSGRCYGTGIELEEREHAANLLQKYVMEHSRLSIPALIEVEASHGLQSLGSVMYPTGIGCAATFHPALYREMMAQIGTEIRLSGNHIAFLTLLDVARDPRWGRVEECLGEDPCLISAFTRACIEGIKSSGTLACAKHFFGAGGCEGGNNAAAVSMGVREQREIHLPPVKAAVEAGADLIMVAYNAIDGVPLHFSKHYLTELLREELGYRGILISDGCGVASAAEKTRISKKAAARAALTAGINLSLADVGAFITLEETVNENPELLRYIDESCVRVLQKKYELNLFDQPYCAEGRAAQFVYSGQSEQTAYRIASESVTLVKNENGLLPLKKDTKICLLGENADNIYYLLGDYTSERKPDEGVTLKAGFESRFDRVKYTAGWRFDGSADLNAALAKAKDCDVVCLCMGGSSVRNFDATYLDNGAVVGSEAFMDCGEGCDNARLELHPDQLELLRQLKAQNKPIVAILIQGRPYAIREVMELADAVLIGWYPGQQGGQAIADIVCGRVNPSGKLPVSIPADAGCLPVCYNTRTDQRRYTDEDVSPCLLPFGFGLSYSTFRYGKLQVTESGGVYSVSVALENCGDLAGMETVLLYLKREFETVYTRRKELFAFEKVALAAGQKQTVRLSVSEDDLHDCITGALPHRIHFMIGDQTQSVSMG